MDTISYQGGMKMVSWVLVPLALFIGVGMGMFLVALMDANEDEEDGWHR